MPGQALKHNKGMLTLAELTAMVEAGDIDTVIMAFTDMQGRLVGKRASARLFIEDLATHGAECCNYLLAVDVEMNTVDGYPMSSWETGYGDMVMNPDMDTLRVIPWLSSTALVMTNLSMTDGTPVPQSPRAILQAQIARLAEKGLVPFVGTELEFIVFDNTYRDAWSKGYTGLTPSSDYNIDYAILASTRMEPLLRDIRNGMDGAGMYCEGVKGECNLGQQEIAFRYTGALATCDNHSIYKNGAKEIADAHGKALTFMAKFNERDIHLSVRGTDGEAVMAGDGKYGFSKLMEHWLAGLIATTRELSLFFAPNINSYKRYVEGSFAPTAIAWGLDNRTCALRVVGHGAGLRVENRVPGGDVNQYLAVAALIAGGLYGIENELELEPIFEGNAYGSAAPRVPTSLRDAAELFGASKVALEAFGPAVVNHYLNNAHIEQSAFDSAVTDWERIRGFERF
jgi:glutamine synthetase